MEKIGYMKARIIDLMRFLFRKKYIKFDYELIKLKCSKLLYLQKLVLP